MARIPKLTRKSLLLSAGVAGFMTLVVAGVVGAAQLLSHEVAQRAETAPSARPLLDISLVEPAPRDVDPGEQMDVGTLVDGFDANSLQSVAVDTDTFIADEGPDASTVQAGPTQPVRLHRSGGAGRTSSLDRSTAPAGPPSGSQIKVVPVVEPSRRAERPSFGLNEARLEAEARREQRLQQRAERETRWAEQQTAETSPSNRDTTLFY